MSLPVLARVNPCLFFRNKEENFNEIMKEINASKNKDSLKKEQTRRNTKEIKKNSNKDKSSMENKEKNNPNKMPR